MTVWGLQHNDWIAPENLQQERFIICASWKVLGEDEVDSVSILDNRKLFKSDPHNDKHVVETLHKMLSAADVIIHHNGNSYDLKFTETRMLFHGLPPLPPIQKIDTLLVAKHRFMFNSNKLDYLAKFLGLGEKIQTDYKLWLRVLQGDKSAIEEMVVYNKHDVKLLEEVYLKLRPYINDHPHAQLFEPGERLDCPRCGSKHTKKNGYHSANTRIYQRYYCLDCKGPFRDNKSSSGVPTRVL